MEIFDAISNDRDGVSSISAIVQRIGDFEMDSDVLVDFDKLSEYLVDHKLFIIDDDSSFTWSKISSGD
jgi:hypothetical protein